MTANPDKRPPRQAVDGLFLLNKPAGITSNQALQKVKRLLNAKKAGHTGSLDPAATGMLPLCFGEATKVCAYLLNADKSYRVTARLGEATDTGDGDGEVTATAEVPHFSKADWEVIMNSFVGDIRQIPPMYSALKKDGKRLYELARKGEVVEREARPVRIHGITLLEAAPTRLVFHVSCSKGTYIRTLVEDIAQAAGTVAYTAGLHRDSVGGFEAEDMLDMAQAVDLAENEPDALKRKLLAPDQALTDWPSVIIGELDRQRFTGGQAVTVTDSTTAGLVRVYADSGEFLGVGESAGSGQVAPRRIFRLGV